MRRVAVLLALLGVGSIAAAVLLGRDDGARQSGTPVRTTATTEQERTADDAGELAALLRRRGTALRRRDAGALARTTTPGRLRAADRRRLERLRGVRLSSVRYVATDITFDRRRARIVVFETHRVAGVPHSLFSVKRTYRAARGRNGWRLTSERLGAEREPWELAPLREVRGRRFVILAPAGLDVTGQGLEPALDAAYDAVRRARIGRPARRYLVVVARDAADAKRLATRISGVESLVAIADSDVREEGPARIPSEVVSARLVLLWPLYLRLSLDGRRTILEHELTHLMSARFTSGRTPAWLVEGLALYVSGDRRVAAATPGLSLTTLAKPDAIGRLKSAAAQDAAYAYASAAAFYVAERYGRRALVRLYRAFGDERVRGALGAPVLDAALRRVLHVSLNRLQRGLRRTIELTP